MMEVKYTTQRLDHLGIVAGICDEISLVGQIDRLAPAPRRQVSVGQAESHYSQRPWLCWPTLVSDA